MSREENVIFPLVSTRYRPIKPNMNWLAKRNNSTSNPPRSALRMLELASRFEIFYPGRVVCDLGAAPGGWSNVAAAVIDLDEVGTRLLDYHDEYMQAEINSEYPPRRPRFSKLISVDITPMDPIPGAAFVQGDFTKPEVQQKIIGYVGGKGVNEAVKSIEDLIIAGVNKPISVRIDSSELSYLIDKQKGIDVILSDMCADAFGVAKDTESSLGVIKHVFEFAGKHLRRPAGTLLIKYFDDPKIFEYLQATIKPMFKHARLLHVEEPKAESRDKYYLCTGFKGRGGKAKAKTPRKNKHTVKKDEGSR